MMLFEDILVPLLIAIVIAMALGIWLDFPVFAMVLTALGLWASIIGIPALLRWIVRR